MNNIKDKIIFLCVLMVLAICVGVGYSTAYFRASITYEDNKPKVNKVVMANVSASFDGGDTVTLEGALPGDSISKTFSITNDNSTSQTIAINFTSIKNTFINSDIVYSIYVVDKDNKTSLIENAILPSTTDKEVVAVDCDKIEANSTKTYEIVLLFKETDLDQSVNMNKEAEVTLGIEGLDSTSCPTNITKMLSTTISSEEGILTTSLDNTIVDETDDKNIRYIGANPNNYIWFNCEDYNNPTEDTCERWRIIGLMNNVSTDDGPQSLVKIVRAAFIGEYAWDNKEDGTYNNTWDTSTIKTLLNDTYYNNGTSKQYYNGSSPSVKTAAFDGTGDTKGITTATKNLIQEVNWNVTAVGGSENALKYYTTTGLTSKYNIGLIDSADYGFSTSGGDTGRNTCLGYDLYDWNSYSECYSNAWLVYSNPTTINVLGTKSWYWTIRPYSGNSSKALTIGSYGCTSYTTSYDADGVRPAIYLKSDIKILSKGEEDGSYEHPYLVR